MNVHGTNDLWYDVDTGSTRNESRHSFSCPFEREHNTMNWSLYISRWYWRKHSWVWPQILLHANKSCVSCFVHLPFVYLLEEIITITRQNSSARSKTKFQASLQESIDELPRSFCVWNLEKKTNSWNHHKWWLVRLISAILSIWHPHMISYIYSVSWEWSTDSSFAIRTSNQQGDRQKVRKVQRAKKCLASSQAVLLLERTAWN